MNPATIDQAMWLVDVWTQLVYNLQEAQKQYKENVDEHQKEQPNFKVGDQVLVSTKTYQDNKAIREVGSSEAKSNLHY
jgi:hypothetical protein